jgi:hypothetical protein
VLVLSNVRRRELVSSEISQYRITYKDPQQYCLKDQEKVIKALIPLLP